MSKVDFDKILSSIVAKAKDSDNSSSSVRQTHVTSEKDGVYVGELKVENSKAIPNGKGSLISVKGGHAFFGSFVAGKRDGDGYLITNSFSVLCKWGNNRPVAGSKAHVVYNNGDLYWGEVSWLEKKERDTPAPSTASTFSAWIRGTSLKRTGWGCAFNSCGVYFGEWENDKPCGFGCMVLNTSDRYIGCFTKGKFDGLGTLFLTPTSLLKGEISFGFPSGEKPLEGSLQPLTTDRDQQRWNGTVMDGLWKNGSLTGEGHFVLASGARLVAMWSGAAHPVEGELICPPQTPFTPELQVHQWRSSFEWESLFLPPDRAAETPRRNASYETFRNDLRQSDTVERMRTVVERFLENNSTVANAVKVFVQIFFFCQDKTYFFSKTDLNLFEAFWSSLTFEQKSTLDDTVALIHSQSKSPFSNVSKSGRLDFALNDLFSFSLSLQRFVLDLLEEEDLRLLSGLEWWISRWAVDRVYPKIHATLIRLYSEVYRSSEDALAAALSRLRHSLTLEDIGAEFAQSPHDGLFDPYSDAIRSVQQLSYSAPTLTSKLKVLFNWSKEIDVSTKMGQGTSGAVVGGADDLIPIYQYILCKANVPNLFSHMKMLADCASEPNFVSATSEESFCATTLQMCVSALYSLHPAVRDGVGILVPLDLIRNGIQERLNSLLHELHSWQSSLSSSEAVASSFLRSTPSEEVLLLCKSFLRPWLPMLVENLYLLQKSKYYSLDEIGLNSEDLTSVMLLVDFPPDVRAFCWIMAAEILQPMHVKLSLHLNDSATPLRFDYLQSICEAASGIKALGQMKIFASMQVLPSVCAQLQEFLLLSL